MARRCVTQYSDERDFARRDELVIATKVNGKMGEGQAPPAQAKAGDGQGQGKAEPKAPGQLAQAQKDLMEATKALAQSQDATQAAQAALGQAQAKAPEAIQGQLKDAAQNLQQAGRTEDARAVYQALAAGQWQERFQWMKNEAKNRLQNR